MAANPNDVITFDAIRQFVVAPDRRYRIELSDGTLRFTRTGSQFDTEWLVRGARPILGDRIAESLGQSSRTKLVLGGIGVSAIAALLLLVIGGWMVSTNTPVRGSHFRGLAVLFVAFIVGVVMLIAGLSTRREDSAAQKHDYSLALADIVDAKVLPAQSELQRRGEPQVARVHLHERARGSIKLGIPTDQDLETLKRALPLLAA